ncbi:MAG: PQQ-dependent sugar dehydrogenase [Chloroflexi bacterium]|nr:PQQ-dependent sugar dehydrogenase [Chloroflexota bacterium]
MPHVSTRLIGVVAGALLGVALLAAAACGLVQSASSEMQPAARAAAAGGDAAPAAPAAPAARTDASSTPAQAAQVRAAQAVVPALVSTTLQVPPSLRRGAFSQDRQLQIREGFSISVFALVPGARSMTLTPWGELLVTQPSQGRIIAVGDGDGDGVAEPPRVFAQGLQCPYGMAFRDGYLYVAQSTVVERFPHDGAGSIGPGEIVVDGLPQSPCAPHHFRPLTFDWAGLFYVAFGSSCNVCVEGDPRRGTVWQFTPDGGGREYASGLRNTVDLEIDPVAGVLWGATNERDNLGDDVPPDPVGPILEGANYGWPYCNWADGTWHRDTRVPPGNPNCQGLTPYNGIQAHSAPLGINFYTQGHLPPEFWGSAFVGLHGSWNRSVGVGFKVIRIPTVDGQPQPEEDFVAGWLTGPRGPNDAWGRPVDVQDGPDGALYVSDDRAGAIYRIVYTGS